MSDADYELIAESIPHIVFVTAADGATEYFNRRGTDYSGAPPEANYGLGWLSLVHVDDVERARRAWVHAVQMERPFDEEYRLRRGDGEYRWHAGRALPVRDEESRVLKWIGTCTDIDEQKRLEHDLRAAERESGAALTLLEALQASAPVGFGLVDRDYRYVRVNDTLAAINGVPIESHLGRPVAEVIPALWPEVEAAYEHVLQTGEAIIDREMVGETAAAPGEARYWLVSLHPVSIKGEVVGIGVLVIDITERKQAEAFRAAVMDNMAEGVFALDSKGDLAFMNAAAAKMLGWTEGELRGKSMHAAVHFQRADGTLLPEEDCPLLTVRAQGRVVGAGDAAFTRKDGTIFPAAYSAAPLPNGANGHGVVVVFRDATHEKAEQASIQHELAALAWVGRIREALDEDRLVLYSQPIRPLADNVPREELLLRMIGRGGEVIPPGAFLPVAEKYGLIREIDRWVIAEAARVAARGRLVQVNLSAVSVNDPELLRVIERELQDAGAHPASIVFEITETALMRNIDSGEAFARGLAEIGCGLALDDFGTGFGSFTYLKKLPANYLKIDIDFVRELPSNPANQHLVRAITSLAAAFGHKTIAEGVEDEQTLTLLRDYGVDYAQGFHVGAPAPILAGASERTLDLAGEGDGACRGRT